MSNAQISLGSITIAEARQNASVTLMLWDKLCQYCGYTPKTIPYDLEISLGDIALAIGSYCAFECILPNLSQETIPSIVRVILPTIQEISENVTHSGFIGFQSAVITWLEDSSFPLDIYEIDQFDTIDQNIISKDVNELSLQLITCVIRIIITGDLRRLKWLLSRIPQAPYLMTIASQKDLETLALNLEKNLVSVICDEFPPLHNKQPSVREERMKIQIKRLGDSKDLPLPQYKSSGASGFDLIAAVETTLEPGKIIGVKTSLSVAIPEGYELQVRPRSGLAINHGITVLNTPGTVDSDYRGEIIVILINHGATDFNISRGDRIAQAVITPVVQVTFEEVDELSLTLRGENGFGSTGLK